MKRPRYGRVLGQATSLLGLFFPLMIGLPTPTFAATVHAKSALTLSSPALKPGKPFPAEFVLNGFGCVGDNVSPPLQWKGVPAGTKSFVITLFDRDEHGTPSGWWHWVLYDIPATADHLDKGAGVVDSKTLPPGARQGGNDDSLDAYTGPCPDEGDAPHHYVWTLYALSVATLPVPAGASGANVTYTAHQYTLGTDQLISLHGRRRTPRNP